MYGKLGWNSLPWGWPYGLVVSQGLIPIGQCCKEGNSGYPTDAPAEVVGGLDVSGNQ